MSTPKIPRKTIHVVPFDQTIKKFKTIAPDFKLLPDRIVGEQSKKIADENLIPAWKNMMKQVKAHRWSRFRRIEFGLSNSEITDKSIKMLAKSVNKHFVQVNKLCLDFGWCSKLTDEGLLYFQTTVSNHLPRLKILRVNFSLTNTTITSDGLDIIQSGNRLSLMRLKQLEVEYTNVKNITDAGIARIGAEITRKMVDLRVLLLNFAGCEKVTDVGLRAIGKKNPRYFNKLRNLYINFGQCPVTDFGFEILKEQVARNLTNLSQLTLSFSGCPNLTNNGVENLFLSICPKTTKLNKFIVYFDKCENISDDGVEVIGSIIKENLVNLEHLKLSFRSNNNNNAGVTTEMKNKLKEEFKHIPSVNVY